MSDLNEKLRILIQQYGISDVRRELTAIAGLRKNSAKPRNAHSYVAEMDLPSEKKDQLLLLAKLFEEKHFLPTAAGIRNFFEAYGAAPIKIKARKDVTLSLFRFLASLSDERLQRISNDGSFGGPSELGPISDAIKAKSRTIRQETEDPSPDGRGDNDTDPRHETGNTDVSR